MTAGAPVSASLTTLTPHQFAHQAAPVQVRFYGPIQRGTISTDWKSAVKVECYSLRYEDVPCSIAESWTDVTSLFAVYGPSTSGAGTNARSIGLGQDPSTTVMPAGCTA